MQCMHNPLVNAAIGAVYSMGGGKHKGVKITLFQKVTGLKLARMKNIARTFRCFSALSVKSLMQWQQTLP